jgi:hypothetical protein
MPCAICWEVKYWYQLTGTAEEKWECGSRRQKGTRCANGRAGLIKWE